MVNAIYLPDYYFISSEDEEKEIFQYTKKMCEENKLPLLPLSKKDGNNLPKIFEEKLVAAIKANDYEAVDIFSKAYQRIKTANKGE